MEVRLIQKGDRGLFISNGNKLLFPDRSWKDAREGFAKDIEITLDKGTYAFVRGKMMDTLPITLDDIFVQAGSYYRAGNFGGTDYIIEWTSGVRQDDGFRVHVKSQNDDSTSIERVRFVGKRLPELGMLQENATPVDITDALAARCQVLNFESDEQYAFEMFKLFQAVYQRSEVGGRVKATMRVYNSSLVLVCHHFEFSGDSYEIYKYDGELGFGDWVRMENFPSRSCEKLWAKSDDLDLHEISDLAMDYKVCLGKKRYGDNSFDERLYSRVFECMGNGVVVYAFNMKGYGPEWFDTDEAQPYINLVEESFARLESLKHQLSKKGIGIDKLGSLSVRSWIMPFIGV